MPQIASGKSMTVETIVLAGEVDRGEHHGGDDGHGVGLEEVGRHAGAVADVVADVVGDGGGVARVVLGDAGLDLADEVAADVRALGEDAAAETGEDRDERAAEAERDQRVDDGAVGRGVAGEAGEDAVVDRDAEQREAGDQHAGDGAGAGRRARGPRRGRRWRPGRCGRWRAPRRACRCSRRRRRARRRSGSRWRRGGRAGRRRSRR